MTDWPDLPTRLRRLKTSALNWDGRYYIMSDGTEKVSWSFLEAANLIEQQAVRIAELEAALMNVKETAVKICVREDAGYGFDESDAGYILRVIQTAMNDKS